MWLTVCSDYTMTLPRTDQSSNAKSATFYILTNLIVSTQSVMVKELLMALSQP